ncbi:hypothetical protein [Patulibacter defluvii]|uniref:hypothetical protein n=1 Tax=Patulibacter defluvii TaxID=3095358 RepID=UPI002A75161B|nr:hypothetical protein [Patulibacter sp. DM4]
MTATSPDPVDVCRWALQRIRDVTDRRSATYRHTGAMNAADVAHQTAVDALRRLPDEEGNR